ncbi:MAG: acyltransferase [Balneolales bacterium]
MKKLLNDLILKSVLRLNNYQNKIAKRSLPEFANKPHNLIIELPRKISNPERMIIGDNSKFGPGCMIKASTRYPGSWMQHPNGDHVTQRFDPMLFIGNNVTATSNLHIAVTNRITIEDDVMFASNVFISDYSHGYDRGDIAYKYQGIVNNSPITIKKGSWICQNVVILPGVTIGKYVIIGANSVVHHSIPDKCIAVGNPARIKKIWDDKTEQWKTVKGRKKLNSN